MAHSFLGHRTPSQPVKQGLCCAYIVHIESWGRQCAYLRNLPKEEEWQVRPGGGTRLAFTPTTKPFLPAKNSS